MPDYQPTPPLLHYYPRWNIHSTIPFQPYILSAKYWIINVNIVRIGIFSCLKIRFGPSNRFLLLKGLVVRRTKKEGKKLPNSIFYYWLYLPKVFSETFPQKMFQLFFFFRPHSTSSTHLLLLILYNDSYITKICWLYTRLPSVDVFCRCKNIWVMKKRVGEWQKSSNKS